ncbi:MAG TPA: tetratricopeptide repeat protein [Acidimicrobiia bacterium]|nr:tetratricopeptide repeat protein [Acidimicrobiia bacterium]
MSAELRQSELLENGRAAIAARDWSLALSLFREADAARALEPSDVERLGEAAFWMGHLEECIAARERAYAGLVEEGDVRAAALVALHLAFHHAGRGAIAVAGGWLESAVALLADLPECAEQGWLTWIQAIVAAVLLADHEEALRLAERTLEIGRAVGDRDVEALGALEKGGAFIHLGRVDEGLSLLDQVMARAVSGLLGPWASAAIYCGTINTCAAFGDYRRAAEWIKEVQRGPGEVRACEFPGDCRLHRAEILQLRGEWEEAEVEAARACDELESWDTTHVAVGLYELGMLSLRRGDISAAEHAFRQVEDVGGTPEPGRATLQLLRGRPEAASASLKEALDAAGSDALARMRLLPAATEAALKTGDVESARRHADELAAIADRYPTVAQHARAAQACGEVAAASDDFEIARAKLREASEHWQHVGARYDEARARVALGLVLRETGEIDAAEIQLQRALDAFERLTATFDVVRVTELLGRAAPHARVVRTFMFTDIEDSTTLLATMGDDRWSEVLRWHDSTLRRLFDRFDGQEIKQRGGGDGFFVAFPSAEAALDCALAIQQAMTESADDRRPPIRVRIGAHEAEATRSVDDYGGRGVHEAARIAALASGGEVLVSIGTVESAGSRHPVTDTRSAALKGLAEPVAVGSLVGP